MDCGLVSIIVPVYKVEAYLDKCVESLVNQIYTNLEIILVDDGSPDNCPAMCDAWAQKDSRIRVIHKENGGLSDARNAGMAVARGEYLAFVDSDDWVTPHYLLTLYNALVQINADISACDVQLVWDKHDEQVERNPNPTITQYTPEAAISDILSGKGFRAVAWNKLYKRELLLGEQYPLGKHHEDEFFTYRILGKAKRLVYVDERLYFYVQRPQSIMRNLSIKRLDALDAYMERQVYLKENFPRLYPKDKAVFCIACVSFYRHFREIGGKEFELGKEKICQGRKRIRFTLGELCRCNLKQLIYIFCSRYAMDVFSKILIYRERGRICE